MWRSLKHVAKGDLAAHWQPNSGACNAPSTPGQAESLAMSCLDGWSLGCPHSSMFCCSPLLSGCRYQSSLSVWTHQPPSSMIRWWHHSHVPLFWLCSHLPVPTQKCNNWHTKLVEYHDYSRVILDCTPYPKTSWYDPVGFQYKSTMGVLGYCASTNYPLKFQHYQQQFVSKWFPKLTVETIWTTFQMILFEPHTIPHRGSENYFPLIKHAIFRAYINLRTHFP
jgi:hypothetical protein